MSEETSPQVPDPFDPEKLRLSQNFIESAGVKKLLTTVPVRKPHKQDLIRVHPDESYRMAAAIVELRDDREVYLIAPDIAQGLFCDMVPVTLYTTINRQGVVFLWHVKMPGFDGRSNDWHTSAAAAAELAMKRWIFVRANMALGAYEMVEASAKIPEPAWPAATFRELLKIAFHGRLIEGADHPVLKRLRGES